ncbi:hypothetical protein DL93DRAFT_2227030 [Clavulina sp. PMI_390]|nr:hypothetical protein DL93DRAFT_2227030 [Clavulina sp. PMI_390]
MATSVKAQEVLNSLMGVLQAEAGKLPAIHAQLGLTHESLEEDLDHLRQELETTIKKLVNGRQLEVNDWERQCHAVERDCVALGKCLGGGVPMDEAFIALVHSEPVLPKRHGMILKHQQDLQKTYATRLDQRNALSRVLQAQERVLGPEFHSSKHTQPLPTTTEYDKDGQVVRRTVTPDKLAEMEAQVQRGKEEISKRSEELRGLVLGALNLYMELGLDFELPAEADPAADTSYVVTADETQILTCPPSPSKPRPKHVPGTQEFYNSILGQAYASAIALGSMESPDIELKGVEPTDAVFQHFRDELARLEPERSRREAQIQAIYEELEILWGRLEYPDTYAEAFVQEWTGITDEIINAYTGELQNMKELRRAHLPRFVAAIREQITELWDTLRYGPQTRSQFSSMVDENYTEELLTIHEEYMTKLTQQYGARAVILEGLKRYHELKEDEDTLRAMEQNTKDRWKGSNLAKEEKLRKKIKREKPKVEKELLPMVMAWEAENNEPLFVDDERLVDVLSTPPEPPKPTTSRSKPAVPARSTTPASGVRKHTLSNASASASAAKRARLVTSTASSASNVTASAPTPVPTGRSRGMGLITPTVVTVRSASASNARPPLHSSAAHNNQARVVSAQATFSKPAPYSQPPVSTPLPPTSIPRPKSALGRGIGLGPPPSSPTRPARGISDSTAVSNYSSTSSVRLVVASSSSVSTAVESPNAAASFRSFSAAAAAKSNITTVNAGDVFGRLPQLHTRRGSYRPRPSVAGGRASFIDHEELRQHIAAEREAASRNWTVAEDSDDDDGMDVDYPPSIPLAT